MVNLYGNTITSGSSSSYTLLSHSMFSSESSHNLQSPSTLTASSSTQSRALVIPACINPLVVRTIRCYSISPSSY